MDVVILAGGLGKRLEEVARDAPKPMVLIAGKPFLEHQINFLKAQGLEDIVLAVHHKSEAIKSYFGEGMRWGVRITYSEEDSPLDTGGAIKLAERYVTGPFFVLNGDSYSDANLNQFLEDHKTSGNLASVLLTHVKDSSSYGSVKMKDKKVVKFSEKTETKKSGLVNSGVYIFEQGIFDRIPSGERVSLEREILPSLASEGELHGYLHRGYFTDIGKPETYYKFRKDFLEKMQTGENIDIREAMSIIEKNKTDLLFVVDESGALLGVLNDNIIRRFLIDGGNVEQEVSEAMVRELDIVGKVGDEEAKIQELFKSGTRHIPILDEKRKIHDIRFRNEETSKANFPIARGKAPLRISFAGGGTDIPDFFETYGGAVINSTIDRYCHATAVKRADSKICIESDLSDKEIILNSRNLVYDGKFDIIKAVFNILNPGFGVDFYLHNDVPPERGLGSSASFAVLITKLMGKLRGKEYSDQELAEVAYRAEVEELGIRGGKQDQYAAVFGGFNWIEFGSGDKKIIHPLRLREDTTNELRSHLTLCYTGMSHQSEIQQQNQGKQYRENEKEVAQRLQRLGSIALEIKENLLSARPNFERVGDLLHESWESKRRLLGVSNTGIDRLYGVGMKNGCYGGKLLGSGGGGYLLFFHPPKIVNSLTKTLQEEGGEILNFNFESYGTKVWNADI